ncbi:MAG: hypothetical protein AB1689_08175 [Thermodesulfobacteriota bacterium]
MRGAPSSRSTRGRRALAIVLAAGASTVVALLVAEVGVRALAPQSLILRRPDVWYPVQGLGWRRSPNLDTTVNFGGAGVVRLRTDADGNRVATPARAGEAPPEVRVLAIGDSFVEALQVEYEDTMTARLEDDLERTTGRPTEVQCAGVGGYNPNQYRLLAQERLERSRYDLLLVFLYVENDVVTKRVDSLPPRDPAPVHRLRLPRRLDGAELRDALFYPVNDWLEVRSHAFVLAKRELDSLLARVGLTAKTMPFHIRKEDAERPWWDVTADVCAEIAQGAQQRGVPTAFVLIPPAYAFLDEPLTELGYDPATMDLLQPHRLLRDKLSARGLWIIDLLPAFQRRFAEGVSCYGDVDSHLNREGHRVAAAVIAPHVRARLVREDARHATR